MKKTISLILIAGLLAFLLFAQDNPAPRFTTTDLNGRTISNAQLQGKVSFINFWFPSCPGCVSEMPKIVKMSQDYRQQPDFQIIGISQPYDSLDSVKNYVQTRHIGFPIIYDEKHGLARAFNTQVYPTSVLTDKKGRIIKTFVGEPDFHALYGEINEELKK
ncbi:MAG: TlpA disulfide reductase family protein [Neisseria sp.]|nr:TlpA disulfide reductase family protein [Neisseria sp.]